MGYPGEEAAWQTIHSRLSSADDKAKASVKLAEINEIRRHNEEGERRWHERKNFCPHCGGKL